MAKRSLYKAWSEDEIERLREHIARGGSVARASVMFGRTGAAVRAQAANLGLKFPTVRELRGRAGGHEHSPRHPGNAARKDNL